MAYADFSGKIIHKSWGRAKMATAEDSVKAGDLLTKDGYIADCNDSKPAFWVACESADDDGTTISVAKMAVIKKPPTVATGGGVTRGDHGGTAGTDVYLASGSDQGEVIEAGDTVIDIAQKCGVVVSQDEVLLRPMDNWIESTLASSSGNQAFRLTVTDTSTGSGTGVYIHHTQSGAKSAATAIALSSNLTVTGATQYAYPCSAYVCQSGNPAIAFVAGYQLYMGDMGTGVSGLVGMDIGIQQDSTQAAATRFAYIRCRSHGSQTPDAILLTEGDAASYLFKTTDPIGHAFVAAGGNGSAGTLNFTNWVQVEVMINDVVYYIPAAQTLA